MKLQRQVGSVSQKLNIFINDVSVSTGAGLANVSSATVSYAIFRDDMAAVSSGRCSTSTGTLGTYNVSCLTQMSSSLALGWYQWCVPDLAFASGSSVLIHLYGATNMVPVPIEVELTKTDNQTYMSSQRVLGAVNPVSVSSISVGVNASTVSGLVGVSTVTDKAGYGVSSISVGVNASTVSGLVGVSTITTSVNASTVSGLVGVSTVTIPVSASSVTAGVHVTSINANVGVSSTNIQYRVSTLVGVSTRTIPVEVSSITVPVGVSSLTAGVNVTSTNIQYRVSTLVGVSTLTIPVGVSSVSIPVGVSSISTPVAASSLSVGVNVTSTAILFGVSTVTDKADYLLDATYGPAGAILSNSVQMNSVPIIGTGVSSDLWRA